MSAPVHDTMLDRVKRVRWLQVPFLGKQDMTEDERTASVACCPCYVVGGAASALLGVAVLVLAVGVAGPPYMILDVGASTLQKCFGRDPSKRWWQREAWFEPEPRDGTKPRDPQWVAPPPPPSMSSPAPPPVAGVKDIETVD